MKECLLSYASLPIMSTKTRYFNKMLLSELFNYYEGNVIKLAEVAQLTPNIYYVWQTRGFVPYKTQCMFELLTNGELIADRAHGRPRPSYQLVAPYRYWDYAFGMCPVKSIHFKLDGSIKIYYRIKQINQSRMTTNRKYLMRRLDCTDHTGQYIYQQDIVRVTGAQSKVLYEGICEDECIIEKRFKHIKYTILGNNYDNPQRPQNTASNPILPVI